MSKSALVTGCFGFIGSHLVDLLMSKGYKILGIGRPRDAKSANFSDFIDSSGFTLIGNDVLDIDEEMGHVYDIDEIYHLATARTMDDPRKLTEVNVIGTSRVLELARRNNVSRIVFSSSAAVYGNPTESPITENTPIEPMNLYAASKLAAEHYINVYNKRYEVNTTILRFFNVFGPRKAPDHGAISIFINQALRNRQITLEGDGSYEYTPIYISDAVKAIYTASQREKAIGSTINISGPQVLRLSYIVQRIMENIEDSDSKILYKKARPGWGSSHIGSTEYMKNILDFVPKNTFDRKISTTIDWYREQL